MKNIRSLLLLCTCLFALGAFAFQSPSGQEGQRPRGPMGRQMPTVDEQLQGMTEQLGLTAAQQSQIKPILEDTRQQMQALMKDDSLSREDRMGKMRSIREASDEKIKAVLTDEQKKKFEERRKEMQERRGKRDQEKGGDSAPPK
ncbi:MAG: hypothetical protein LAP21_00940 [Acidobacteriia bacterium]|nr:hypothetical protein [Terriglobia bacterium]